MDVFGDALYESSSEVFEVKADEAQRAASQCLLFLRACVDGTLTNEILQAAGQPLLLHSSSHAGRNRSDRIWIVTNGLVKNARYKPQKLPEAVTLVTLEVVDLLRLSRMALEAKRATQSTLIFP